MGSKALVTEDLKVGDKVVLDDVFTGKTADKQSGVGYKVTAVTERYVECRNDLDKTLNNRTKYYGRNDLHLIRKVA